MSPEISVIVCHRNPEQLGLFKESLNKTIGVEFELVVIDNTENDYSIFQAYNLGVERSKGKILCFSHEDVAFHTQHWGQLVLRHFMDAKIGMIGVAGGNCMPGCPSPWWTNATYNDHLVNLIQHWTTKSPRQPYYTFLNEEKTLSRAYSNPNNATSEKAVAIDGLWFCIPRSLFDHISFDEITYHGFHCYDSDISLQVFQTQEVRVVYDILIEHFSDANPNKDFLDSCIGQYEKWKHKLPAFAKEPFTGEQLARYEFGSLLEFAYFMKAKGFYTDKEIRRVLRSALRTKVFNFKVKDAYLLVFWSVLGYKLARFPYFFVRKILK